MSVFFVIALLFGLASPVIVVIVVIVVIRKLQRHDISLPTAPSPDWLARLQQLHQQQMLNDPFMQAMQQLHVLIQQAQAQQQAGGGIALPGSSSAAIPPHLQAQIQAQAMKAQREMAHFDALARERSELSMASMMSDASAAGIDVSSWNYRY